jgi:hypothetical protein
MLAEETITIEGGMDDMFEDYEDGEGAFSFA